MNETENYQIANLNSLVEYTQDGIAKCRERIEKLESIDKSYLDLSDRIEKLESNLFTNEFKVDMEKGNKFIECLGNLELKLTDRIEKVEKILKPYLEPNTRDDLDRLEQRFRIIELKISELKSNYFNTKSFKEHLISYWAIT